MSIKSKSKQEEALQFLDDLDSLSPVPPSSTAPQGTNSTRTPNSNTPPPNDADAAEALAFLDEITQKSAKPAQLSAPHIDRPISRSGTPTLRKSAERVRVGTTVGSGGSPLLPSSSSASLPTKIDSTVIPEQSSVADATGGWGWGSVWSSASAAIQQAKTVVDERVKNLPKNEQARKWSEGMIEYAKNAQLEKLGQDFKRVGLSTLTDILNVVAPPISEHEVIRVWLSHDMQGYDGIESLVYRALARIMEQVEGGDLIVNRGDESRPRDTGSDSSRDLNAVDGHDAAFKLAQANLDELIKNNSKPTPEPASAIHSPTTYSQVYLRVQPFLNSFTHSNSNESSTTQTHLQFILYLSDPAHQLVHTTITQSIPGQWLGIWDDYDWVEDLVAEVLRVGVEVVGQEYVVARMGWGMKDKGKGKENARSEASESEDSVVVVNEKESES